MISIWLLDLFDILTHRGGSENWPLDAILFLLFKNQTPKKVWISVFGSPLCIQILGNSSNQMWCKTTIAFPDWLVVPVSSAAKFVNVVSIWAKISFFVIVPNFGKSGPNLRFVVEAIFKPLVPKSGRSSITITQNCAHVKHEF